MRFNLPSRHHQRGQHRQLASGPLQSLPQRLSVLPLAAARSYHIDFMNSIPSTASLGGPTAVWMFLCSGIIFGIICLRRVFRLRPLSLGVYDEQSELDVTPALAADEWRQSLTQLHSENTCEHERHGANFQLLYFLGRLGIRLNQILFVAFAVPWVYLSAKGNIPWKLQPVFTCLFGLMLSRRSISHSIFSVFPQSDTIDAEAYNANRRYAVDVSVATTLFTAFVWTALASRYPVADHLMLPNSSWLGTAICTAAVSTWFTIVSGACTAGPSAPLAARGKDLENRLPPLHGLHLLAPVWRNSLSDGDSTQGHHRLFAFINVCLAVVVMYLGQGLPSTSSIGVMMPYLKATLAAQVALGALAAFWGPTVPLVAAHQGTSLALLTVLLQMFSVIQGRPFWL